jgi:hypothetical protein
MTWTLEARPNEPILDVVQVLILHEAWRRLTKTSRAALVAAAEGRRVGHPASLRALRSHGLLDENGVTAAGAAVLRFRPDQTGENDD